MRVRFVPDCVEKEAENEGYYEYSPTLPGCFSNGKTLEEARRNVREAIEQHMASLLAHTKALGCERGSC